MNSEYAIRIQALLSECGSLIGGDRLAGFCLCCAITACEIGIINIAIRVVKKLINNRKQEGEAQ